MTAVAPIRLQVAPIRLSPEAQQRLRAVFAELAGFIREVVRAVKAWAKACVALFARLAPQMRRVARVAADVDAARRLRVQQMHRSYRRRSRHRRRHERRSR